MERAKWKIFGDIFNSLKVTADSGKVTKCSIASASLLVFSTSTPLVNTSTKMHLYGARKHKVILFPLGRCKSWGDEEEGTSSLCM